jgi:hypothetical protein
MHITGGYAFRNAIGMIKNETYYATMLLTPKSIIISFINNNRCASHKLLLHTSELTGYHYNFRDTLGNLLPEYPITFETNELFNTTKAIGRRDAIRLYLVMGEDRFSVQPIKGTTKEPGKASALFVKIINKEYVKLDNIGGYTPEPNVRVPAKDFADLCSQANTLKCNSVEIIGQSNAVTFKGILANNSLACINRFSSAMSYYNNTPTNTANIDNVVNNFNVDINNAGPPGKSLSLNILKSEDLMTVKIPISTVKALGKIHNISPPGTLLKFYFKENKPTKVESPIDTYGVYTICLRTPRMTTNQQPL